MKNTISKRADTQNIKDSINDKKIKQKTKVICFFFGGGINKPYPTTKYQIVTTPLPSHIHKNVNLCMANGEGKLYSNLLKSAYKLTLCHVLVMCSGWMNTRVGQKFYNILVRVSLQHIRWLKPFKSWTVAAVVDSIIVVGVLNVVHCLPGCDWCCKNLDNQEKLAQKNTIDSGTVLQATELNLVCSTWRLWGEPSISQSRVVFHLHDLSKSIWCCQIVSHITKTLKNFWLTQVNFHLHAQQNLNRQVTIQEYLTLVPGYG